MRYMNIGSVSSGTLRNEDLLDTFLDVLKDEARQQRRYKEFRKLIKECEECPRYIGDAVDELIDALNELSPPYFYFGTSEGDGADFGWWFAGMDSYDGLVVVDLAEIPRGYTGEVMLVDDHGNATLYRCVRGRRYEQWSIV